MATPTKHVDCNSSKNSQFPAGYFLGKRKQLGVGRIMLVILAGLFLLQLPSEGYADIIDAPHNLAGGITCQTCHSYSLWWRYSPSTNAPDRANIIEVVCGNCHAGDGAAPHVTTHSSAALGSLHRETILPPSGWARTCTDCHDPHFQAQLRGWAGNSTVPDTELYLAQGTISAITSNGGSINYTLNQAKTKPAWANPADWTNKTTPGRGLLLVVSAGGMENTYKIVSAIENSQTPGTGSISVQGVIDSSFAGQSFGLIYGQLIKKQIAVDPDRDGVFQKADVKFFDGRGGFVDNDPADGITGICQVCHGQTLYFLSTVAPDPHIDIYGVDNAATLQCTICHNHTVAFGHGSEDGGSGCAECHNNQHDNHDGTFTYSKHVEHLNVEIKCSACHDLINIRDASGKIVLKDGAHLATTTVCVGCHHDGTALPPAGGNPPNQADYKSGWSDTGYVFSCNGCHGTPPAYATGSPKANSHLTHTNDGISCDKCHYSTTQDGSTLLKPGTHANNSYNVSPAPGVTLTYAGGTCSNISCHLGNTATWGGEKLSCLNCHQTSGSDVEGVIDPNAVAQINITQWNTTGHGRPASEQYAVSGNAGAGLTCYYCHDNSIAHGSAVTPFRLINIGGADGMNGVCLTCHKDGASGYQPPYTGMDLIASTRKVNSFHGYNDGLGGKFCWDCHDPHGDTNIYMIHDRVSLRSDKVTGAPTLQSMPVVFTQKTSGADYAKTSTPFNGICNVCHLNTQHYTSTSGNGGHDNGQICTTCHHHNGNKADNAFSQGECLDCHNVSQPAANPTRRAIAAEFPQTSETAGSAHAHFGGQLDSNDCRVCHNQIYHMDGQIRLWGGDKEVQKNLQGELVNTSIVYIGNNAGDMVNIEAQKYEDISDFCMSCHDSDGMNSSPYPFDPFGNGNRPPDVASRFKGTRVASDEFIDPYLGMFGSGRAVLSHHPLSKSDQAATGSKIECTNCHGSHSASRDTKLADPDDTSKTWGSGPGQMNAFCLKCHDGGTNPHHPGFPAGVTGPTFHLPPGVVPGALCPDNYTIYDCRGECVDPDDAEMWSVDTYCDDGTYGMNLQCAAFGNDNNVCGSYVNNDGFSLLKGLETCEGYSQAPWNHQGTKIPWSKEAHGGGTKRRWPGYVQDPPVPTYELDCIGCHDPHGSYNPPSNTFGNPYMIRDFVDGAKYVDDGNIRYGSARLGCSDVTTDPPLCSKFGTSGAVVIDKPNFKRKGDGGLSQTTFNGWVGFCNKCHVNWENATSSGGHLINGGYSSCLSCHAHGTVSYGGQDNYGYPWYSADPDNTPEVLCH